MKEVNENIPTAPEVDKDKLKDKNKLQPCQENNLITQNGQVREGLGVSTDAKILMG